MRVFSDRFPRAVSSAGVLLGLTLLVETLVVLAAQRPPYDGFHIGVVTSIPFVSGLVYAGYWLDRSRIRPEQYPHVRRWWVAGTIAVVLLISAINLRIQPLSVEVVVGTVRWSVAIGGALGLVIGVFQARAVRLALETERIRRRQRETQRERDRLETFASTISHDLQNPLHVASGSLELLREECDSPHIDPIATAHDRMGAIVDDTLELARAGRTIEDTAPVELSAAARTSWELVETGDATLSAQGRATVWADRDRLQRLFGNVFANAIRHGGPEAAVRVGPLEDAAGFYIEDDGAGIPTAERSRVFRAGYSASEDGTGLGLSIVKQIVEAHGWEISVTESDDGGARFEITGTEPVDT